MSTTAHQLGLPPVHLADLTRSEVAQWLARDGVRPVHADALWRALYRLPVGTRSATPALPAPISRWLAARFGSASHLARLPVVRTSASEDGRTRKYLLRLEDGAEVETVTMGYPGRLTACISTQAGCAMGCVFCATGQMGFSRHLRPGEIVAQVLHAREQLLATGEHLRNLVLMGMGEPLHNYDQVMQALDIVTDQGGVNIGPSRVTVNTVGVVPGILRMARERRPYHLGVSLHGSTEAERVALVPVSQRWPLAELIDACRTYTRETGRKVFFAWTLVRGVNDTTGHALRLTALLAGLPAHVNLIRLNPTAGYAGRDSDDAAAHAFRSAVQAAGIPCTIRQRRGIDVAAGCGQLATGQSRP